MGTGLSIIVSGWTAPYASVGSCGLLLLLLLLHLLVQLLLLLPQLRLLLQCHEELLCLYELWIVGGCLVRLHLFESLCIVNKGSPLNHAPRGYVIVKHTSYMSLICCCVKLAGRPAPGKCTGAAAGCTEAIIPGQRGTVSKRIEKICFAARTKYYVECMSVKQRARYDNDYYKHGVVNEGPRSVVDRIEGTRGGRVEPEVEGRVFVVQRSSRKGQ